VTLRIDGNLDLPGRADPRVPRDDDAARRRDGSERQLAWQRAMEEAAGASWYKRVAPSRAAAESPELTSAPGEPLVPQQRQSAGPACSFAVRSALPTAPQPRRAAAPSSLGAANGGVAPAQGPVPEIAADLHPEPTSSVAPPAAQPFPAAEHDAATLLAARSSAGRSLRSCVVAALPPAAQERLRMHAERAEDGVRLWIGIDPGLVPLDRIITTLLDQVRRALGERGLRLRTLVCNGRTLWDAAADLAASSPSGDPEEVP
jgi:hypothetical protein